jgi:site-specific recombinase XerD
MPTIKLTKAAVARLRAPDPSGKQKLYWDEELRGFGVLLSGVTNSRTYVAQRTLPDGRTRRITVGSVAEIDVDQARESAADLIHQMRHGNDPRAARRRTANWTLQRALDEYLKARHDLNPKSAAFYRHEVEHNLAAWLDRPLRSITHDEVEDRHRAIAREVAKRRGKLPDHFANETGAHTANMTLRVFGILWNFVADRDAEMPANPVRRLKRQWYSEKRRERWVKPDQLPVFYRAVDGLDNRVFADLIKLMLFTGLRRSEACALRWDPNIDFTSRVIRIPAAETKPGTPLDLPMTSFVYELLVARRAIGNAGWVFPSHQGHIKEPRDHFDKIAASCGVKVSSHDLRRTFATIAESTDISGLALKALLNHTLGNSDVTSGYVRMTVERLREPAERVSRRLVELCEIATPKIASVKPIILQRPIPRESEQRIVLTRPTA